ncbi:TPA: hypothetical protein ACH3X1_013374 [Trebouxia sp. C0004]
MQTPLAGFGFVPNVFDLYFPDRMHSSALGPAQVVQTMIQQHPDCIIGLARLNKYIAELPQFPGFNVPSFGLTPGEKASAAEFADLFKVLPVTILAVSSLRVTFLYAVQELLEFQTLRDLEQHSRASLKALEEQRKRAQYALLELEKEGPDGLPVPMQTSNWAIPKFNLMKYWLWTIMAFGSANVTSTGFGERSHVALKEAMRFTNRRSAEAIDDQSLKQVTRKRTTDVMAKRAEADANTTDNRSSSAGQKACERGVPCLASGRAAMVYFGTDTTVIAGQLPDHPHILLSFQWAIGRHLATQEEVEAAVNIGDLPRTFDGKVGIIPNAVPS